MPMRTILLTLFCIVLSACASQLMIRYDSAPDADQTAEVEAVMLWDVPSDDFVYCLALAHDMQYVAYGGTAKKVCVLSALSGTTLFEVPQAGIVWSVALL